MFMLIEDVLASQLGVASLLQDQEIGLLAHADPASAGWDMSD